MSEWESTSAPAGGQWDSTPAAPADSTWNGDDAADSFDNDDFKAGGDGTGDAGSQLRSGNCRRCNEEGHWSKDCPNAPPMLCKECESPDHVVKDCPERVCKNCGQKGHTISQCEGARLVDRSGYPDVPTDEAWSLILKAAAERDIDDVKQAIQIYVKSAPETTFTQLEEAFRSQGVNLWLIAIEKSGLAATMTNMDLQGNMEKKHTVTYRFQWNPPRPRDREAWPADEAENLERLNDAGEVVPRGLPKCSNCSEIGHIAKSCPEDKREVENVNTIMCYNCGNAGHRVRDCPTPRVDKFACKNCGQSGHKVTDCTEPPNLENVECRKCNEMGHFSKDCPKGGGSGCRNCGQEGHVARDCTEPKNMDNVQCRNCEEHGHMSKECPKPRNIVRVKCSNCQQLGHFKSKCPNPLVDEDATDNGGFGGGGFGDGGFDSPSVTPAAPAHPLGSGWVNHHLNIPWCKRNRGNADGGDAGSGDSGNVTTEAADGW